jgi:hypothetical protein
MIRVVILDRGMIHPYASRSKDVLRIEAHNERVLTQAVILPKVQWEVTPMAKTLEVIPESLEEQSGRRP